MAAGRIVVPNYMPALDLNGDPVPGAKLYFYENETTTLKAVYTTAALDVAHPNPVVADAAGAFPSIFADTDEEYSVAITDANGLPVSGLRNRDNLKATLFYGDDVVAEAEAARDAAVAATANKLNLNGDNVAGNAAALRASIGFASYVRPEDFNASAGTGGDDTAAVQAAINAAKGSGPSGKATGYVVLAGKDYRVPGGLIVDRPVHVIGHGAKASRLVMPESMTVPAIRIRSAHDGNNYFTNGEAPAEIKFANIGIKGLNRDATAGQNVAHAIDLQPAASNPVYTRVIIEDVMIEGAPGDGISSQGGWGGLLEWRSSYIAYVGRYGVLANSVADWRFINGDVFGARKDNLLFSSAIAMQMVGVNVYVANENNMHIFGNSSVVAQGCYFDLADQHNIKCNMDPTSDLRMTDCTVRWSSQSADNAYSDLYMEEPPRGGRVHLSNVKFLNPLLNPYSARGPKFNIEFGAGATNPVFMPGVIFTADDDTDGTRGPLARARISNDMRRIRLARGEIPAATATQIGAATDLVNRVGKRAGAQVFDTTNNRYLAAIGPAATDGWYYNGSLVVTPA